MASFWPWGREKRTGPPPGAEPWGIPGPGDMGTSQAGVSVNETTALGIPAAMACVRILSTTISSLPWHALSEVDGVQFRTAEQPKFLADPFIDVPLEVGLTQLVASMALKGGGFAVVVGRDDLLYPSKLQIVHPDTVRRTRQNDGTYAWSVNRIAVPDADMVHIPHLVLAGSIFGLSVIEYNAGSIGLTLAAERFGATFFKAGMHGTGVLTTPDRLDNLQAKELAERLAGRHVGASNWQNPFVLTGGMAWQPLSITPEESQFLQTRGFQRADIAGMFGVPPHLIGDVDKTSSWGSGVAEQGRAFVSYTLLPYLRRIESVFSRMIPGQQVVRFDVDELIRPDLSVRATSNATALTNGWLNADEVRLSEGMAPIPNGEGKTYRHPANIIDDAAPTAAPPVVPPVPPDGVTP